MKRPKITHPLIIGNLIWLSLVAPAYAESRNWKSSDGIKSIDGDYKSRDDDSVTIQLIGGKIISIPIELLHEDDKKWLSNHHPADSVKIDSPIVVFDQIKLGDTRTVVFGKLESSNAFQKMVQDEVIDRLGMNRAFEAKKKYGGLRLALYFEWTEESKMLKELTLQTKRVPQDEGRKKLTVSWNELLEVLTLHYGKPIIFHSSITDLEVSTGLLIPTHVWQNDEMEVSIQLGVSQEIDSPIIAVRMSVEKIKIVPVERELFPGVKE